MSVPYLIDSDAYDVVTFQDIEWAQKDAIEIAAKDNKELDHIRLFKEVDGEEVYISYKAYYKSNIKRTRRITGYFSDISNFNPAKKAELRDRKPHM